MHFAVLYSRGMTDLWRSRYLRFGITALSVLLLLVSCGDSDEDDDLQVFRYNQSNQITSLDPAFARSQTNIWTVDHLYDGLVTLDEDMKVAPAIAHSWSISEDGLDYVFHLRTDVKFHEDDCWDGPPREVVAEDFVYSFERILSPDVSSPGSWIFRDKVDQDSAFTALDDSTFRVRLVRPFLPFLGILTMEYCSVVPREAIGYYGKSFRSHAVGTGPFRLKRWIENQAMFLLPHEKYFAAEDPHWPYLDGVKISFIADRKTAYLEFLRGELDMLTGIESSYVNELLTKDGQLHPLRADQMILQSSPFLNTEYIGINLQGVQDESPLQHQQVRQAMNYAIDRPTMIRALRNGIGAPAQSGFIPRGLPSYDADRSPGYMYDQARARALIAEATELYGELGDIQLHVNKDYLDIATYLVKAWESIGLDCDIQLDESSLLREGMRRGDIDLFRASWIADYPDAENFLTVFYSGNPAPPNYTRFRNDEFDQLYEQSLGEINESERYELYRHMNEIIIEQAPVIFLYYDETAVFYHRHVKGLELNASKLLKLHRVRIQK